jgi:methanogenic corrinoid protein MtbC1
LAAVLGGDRRGALRCALDDALAAGLSVDEVQDGVVRAAQREIGRLWEQDRISIAQEHMATAIAHVVLAHLYQRAKPAPAVGRKILVACVEGELHDFPARLAADALDLAGFDVRFLGANVPTDDLLPAIRREAPDLLALSVTMTFNVPALRTAVARVREAEPQLPIAIGGHACTWSRGLAADLGVACVGDDAAALVQAARERLGTAA